MYKFVVRRSFNEAIIKFKNEIDNQIIEDNNIKMLSKIVLV